jgi:nucleotide-binding universal stress UspA family protein
LWSGTITRSIGAMITSSPAPDAALATAERSLTTLEGTLSQMAADSAIAAETLRDAGAATSPEAHIHAATWWLQRLAASALATRATCRAARAAIRTGGAPPAAPARSEAAGTAAATRRLAAERTHGSERSIVVGYDGSDAAKRALARAAESAGEHGTVVIVTIEPQLFSAGPAAEPLVEPGDDPSRLIADARVIVAERGTVGDVVVVTREGDPAEELLDIARSVGADRIVIGRRGKNFVARTLMGSVATRILEHAPCDVLVVV